MCGPPRRRRAGCSTSSAPSRTKPQIRHRILSKVGSEKKTKPPPGRPAPYRGQGRKPIYTNDVRKALVKVWAILDCPRGKRLSAALPDTIKPFVEGS